MVGPKGRVEGRGTSGGSSYDGPGGHGPLRPGTLRHPEVLDRFVPAPGEAYAAEVGRRLTRPIGVPAGSTYDALVRRVRDASLEQIVYHTHIFPMARGAAYTIGLAIPKLETAVGVDDALTTFFLIRGGKSSVCAPPDSTVRFHIHPPQTLMWTKDDGAEDSASPARQLREWRDPLWSVTATPEDLSQTDPVHIGQIEHDERAGLLMRESLNVALGGATPGIYRDAIWQRPATLLGLASRVLVQEASLDWVPTSEPQQQYGRTQMLRQIDAIRVHWFQQGVHGCEPALLVPTATICALGDQPHNILGHWTLGNLAWDAPLTLIPDPHGEGIRIRAEQLGGPEHEFAWKISMPAEVRISLAELRGMQVE